MKKGSDLFDKERSGRSEVDKCIDRLFKPSKTIRDAVHGDIMLTDLEIKIMDTKSFQRLHTIRQLGTTYLVYPCAKHSRFEHALGCLAMAERIISLVNANPYPDILTVPHDRLIVRLCALLHDLAHIPFGHTLEDEAHLFESQWQDQERMALFLGEGSEIAGIIRNYPLLNEIANLGRPEFAPSEVSKELQRVLLAMETHKIEEVSKPYLCDIIGNTLCADLLDYVRRDFYFTGLKEDYDDRFLSYLYITKYKGKARLVLRLIKPATGRLRRDVLSELLHLLRLRYSLAEKVYYHHAKISSSAMIISAVSRCIDKLDRKDVYFMSDDALIKELKKKGTEASIRLLENLESRQLYKPVYGLRYEGELSSRAEDKQELIEELRQTENRVKAETYLEKTNGLEPGSIVVYCPGEEMGHKAVKAIVNLNGRIGPLDEIGPPRVKEEIRSSITERHLELWAMYVFADRDLPDDVKGHIQHECTRLFGGLQNEIEDAKKYYDKNSIPYQIRYEERYAKEHKKQQMSSEEVLHIAARSKEGDDAKYNCLSYEEYYQLREGL